MNIVCNYEQCTPELEFVELVSRFLASNIRKINGKFPPAPNRSRRCRVDYDQLVRPTIHQEQLVITQNLEPIFAMNDLTS